MDYIKECEAYLVRLLHALVDQPNAVVIRTVAGRRSVIFEVEPAPEDLRWVIGKKGRTAEAIRELMASLGGRHGQRFLVEFFGSETAKLRALRSRAPRRRIWTAQATSQ